MHNYAQNGRVFFRLILLIVLSLVISDNATAQNLRQYKKDIKTLSSRSFHGRGYYKSGVNKAGEYIAYRFKSIGAKPLYDTYYQDFTFDVNVYHGKTEFSVDGKELVAGTDFVMREFSPGCKGTFDLYYVDTLNFDGDKLKADVDAGKFDSVFLVIDIDYYFKHSRDFQRITHSRVKGIVAKWSVPLKFYKAYSDFTTPVVIVWVSPDFPSDAKSISIDVDSKMLKDYNNSNVIASIKGKKVPDSVFVITAHYDHLGHFGKKLYFPGANDNASGTALLLSLAKYYSEPENAPDYTIVFMAFAGEETGLRGSTYYAENPLFPLGNIKYLINVDMIADNAPFIYAEVDSIGSRGFDLFTKINEEQKYFTEIEKGELNANSDHYPFTEKNVPAIFFMTEHGDAYPLYHTPKDTFENIYFDVYPKLHELIMRFVDEY